jgi:hypothetical protein
MEGTFGLDGIVGSKLGCCDLDSSGFDIAGSFLYGLLFSGIRHVGNAFDIHRCGV